ncbi:hypothetical protein AAY473_009125 [Plecturocebus cupreus]
MPNFSESDQDYRGQQNTGAQREQKIIWVQVHLAGWEMVFTLALNQGDTSFHQFSKSPEAMTGDLEIHSYQARRVIGLGVGYDTALTNRSEEETFRGLWERFSSLIKSRERQKEPCNNYRSMYTFVPMGFHHVGQAGLELLTSGDPPTSACQISKAGSKSLAGECGWNCMQDCKDSPPQL